MVSDWEAISNVVKFEITEDDQMFYDPAKDIAD